MNYLLLSSIKHENKIQEDINLKNELSINHKCDIIAWENVDQSVISNYDVFIIRSVWGYHLNHEKFNTLIKKINDSKKAIINSYDNVRNNISKLYQYEFCTKNNLKIIPSYFITSPQIDIAQIKSTLNITNDSIIVIKPIISASGDGTQKIKLSELNINEYNELFLKDNGIVIQPYIESINNGEYSAIIIDNKLEYVVTRFPGVLSSEKKVELLPKIPQNLLSSIQKCISAIKKLNTCYYRLDFFEVLGDYYINEIEMVDPDLFTRKIDKEIANQTTKKFANAIIKI